MAHAVLPDGSIDPAAAGAMIGLEYAMLTATIDGVEVDGCVLAMQWFLVSATDYFAGSWEIALPPSASNPQGPDEHMVAIEMFGHRAGGVWGGPGRVCGKTPFPLSRAEWEPLRTQQR